MKTLTKKAGTDPAWILDYKRWGVSNYGVALYVNHSQPPLFLDGASLDVEDDEQGNFVGLGICGQPVMCAELACYYWSDWEIAKTVVIPRFIAHNGVSDLRKLQKWGYKIDNSYLMWDTMLMAHILDSTASIGFGLKDLVEKQLGIKYPSYDDIVGRKTKKQKNPRITLDKQPLDLVSEYNACDTYTTYKLYERQVSILRSGRETSVSLYFKDIELPMSFIFNDMSEKGVKVDLSYINSLKVELEAQKKPVEQEIKKELGDINLNSTKQLLEALNSKGIFPLLKGKPSTDKRALENLKQPVVQLLKDYSEIDTLLSSFVNPYIERNEEIVHPRFKQCGTRTGRPSCSNPNLLQIPKRTDNGKRVRRMFIARDGYLFGCADYKEGEPRMLAHLSKDDNMCALFNEGRGFHDYFAEHLNISRDRAKVFDLETYYRATKFGVARHLNCGYVEAQKRIDEAWALFPTLYDWEQKIIYQAKKDGYITTLMGRRIKIEGLDSDNPYMKESAERQAMNNIAQGSLQEVTKKAMIEIDKAGITMLTQVYDDVLWESPEQSISGDVQTIIDKMENSFRLIIPLVSEAKVGSNWGEMN